MNKNIFASEKAMVDYYVDDCADAMRALSTGSIAAWMSETVQGVGGCIPLPDGYLSGVYEHVKKFGGVTIADEVQTGFGRCGTHFWGFETQGVMPDIVTMAKGIGNGIPLGCVAAREDIMDHIGSKVFFNTYGAQPIQMAVAQAVLDIIDEEKLQQNCLETGAYFVKKLRELQKEYPIIADIRGKGLMLGLEHGTYDASGAFVPDRETTTFVFNALRDEGVLIGGKGRDGNCFRLKPPMIITRANVDFAIEKMSKCYAEARKKFGN